MKLKFKKAVAAGREIYQAGKEYEVKDQHAADVYVAHGYAEPVGGNGPTGETLRRSHPGERAQSPTSKVQSAEPAKAGTPNAGK